MRFSDIVKNFVQPIDLPDTFMRTITEVFTEMATSVLGFRFRPSSSEGGYIVFSYYFKVSTSYFDDLFIVICPARNIYILYSLFSMNLLPLFSPCDGISK